MGFSFCLCLDDTALEAQMDPDRCVLFIFSFIGHGCNIPYILSYFEGSFIKSHCPTILPVAMIWQSEMKSHLCHICRAKILQRCLTIG